MKIRKAIRLARQGSHLRRASWPSGLYMILSPFEECQFWEGDEQDWGIRLDADSILAEDWEVVE